MTVKVQVLSDAADSYVGKRGFVSQQTILVMDMSETGPRLKQPLEYALADGPEKERYANKLQGKLILLGIKELQPFGGRFRVRGEILQVVGEVTEKPVSKAA